MSMERGFAPVFDEKSRVLILGSFPSVLSRAEGFYYGNPQNRFWKMLSSFFHEELPTSIAQKMALLLGHGVALWDIVAQCEITGSKDDSIRGEQVVDLHIICGHAPIERVLCNGTKAHSLLLAAGTEGLPPILKLPSTSPANPRYLERTWHEALAEIFANG